ncbi:uncharacterized protein LOC142559319 [Dermacentor variabilis]|uniref:uncharacterized protein LOC142559319 n=1 Tax=Dermacentor variabilis TaxID=34621 RepID=UPI003F5C25F6
MTKTGHHILRELGYFPPKTQDPPEFMPVSRELRDLTTIAPIPRNVHPEQNRGRRLARATAFLKRINKKAGDVAFVDAGAYRCNRAFAAVAVSSSQRTLNATTVRTRDPKVAEQLAIAQSIQLPFVFMGALRTRALIFPTSRRHNHYKHGDEHHNPHNNHHDNNHYNYHNYHHHNNHHNNHYHNNHYHNNHYHNYYNHHHNNHHNNLHNNHYHDNNHYNYYNYHHHNNHHNNHLHNNHYHNNHNYYNHYYYNHHNNLHNNHHHNNHHNNLHNNHYHNNHHHNYYNHHHNNHHNNNHHNHHNYYNHYYNNHHNNHNNHYDNNNYPNTHADRNNRTYGQNDKGPESEAGVPASLHGQQPLPAVDGASQRRSVRFHLLRLAVQGKREYFDGATECRREPLRENFRSAQRNGIRPVLRLRVSETCRRRKIRDISQRHAIKINTISVWADTVFLKGSVCVNFVVIG